MQRGRRLEYFTIAWNTLEGLVAIAAGVIAGSVSLVGFGMDSFIEVTSGAALLWRMSADADERRRERIERITLRIVGACFIALAVYVGYERGDLLRKRAHMPLPGIIPACVSLVVMPFSRAGVASKEECPCVDAKQTQFCTYLSAILLGGLVLNAAFDLWWADPAAGLVMVPIIAREGVEGLRGDTCCD